MQDLPAETTRDLFTPIEVGPLTLPNRIVMAPLTRSRAGPGNVPTALSALYYAQRASAGLIISEATQVAPEGQGYISTPGIYSAEQVAGWKCLTGAVDACGGRMVLQLWHVGRISHPSFQPGGALPIAPSAIRPNAKAFTANGFEEIPTPRALETSEIPDIVAQYAQGARNAPLVIPCSTMSTNDSLPDDVETLKRLLLASNAELAQARAEATSAEALVVHLRLMIEKLKRGLFGARNERKARLIDQMELQLEELEAAATEDEIAAEQAVAASSET